MNPEIPSIELSLRDEAATRALAGAIAPHLGPGFVLYLSGDLGAGKTAFTRALLRALGWQGRVRSPTFTLAELYELPNFDLYHFDFYRFAGSDEWREAGIGDYLGGQAAAVVEWPEMAEGGLPDPDLWLRLAYPDDDPASEPHAATESRTAHLSGATDRGRACVVGIADACALGLLAGVCSRPRSGPSPLP
ncbi:MAG TPA: tRNA (adenosine(37)-N6)-threonylcarbamoyltransferase complex ATPase subunit type 1 TsaE [Quisquiliibacterium sp.]|nr:tRNA (adenosine(37)-N6)-threonylcarbamoyltransferase complex ATPase subunit type 1 TsaE [Quisquiliibacterium sp.]HQN12567.1 tRNA (adenosine(37)-N6)-threonylcarbamoyltransferase complex ATPase subunit type 1 TsaE [Quisquiliibacterium sp.]